MEEKTLLELAFEYVSNSNKPVTFKALWAYVVKQKGLTEEEAQNKVSQLYTNLLLDGRFVNLGDNRWDLRSRNTFDKVHIDMGAVYSEDESEENEGDVDMEEAEELKEEEAAFEEPVTVDKNEIAPDFDSEEEINKDTDENL